MIKCSNCHFDIEQSKIVLHERFCAQNIKYCELCKEGIIKEEYEDHCLEHNKPKTVEPTIKSEEERSQMSLKRVQSSKICCRYCELFCAYDELEEHEAMCGARTTQCRMCGKNLLYSQLDKHIKEAHDLGLENYKTMDSFSGEKSNNSLSLKNLNTSSLNRMTSDEQLAYAIAMSEQTYNKKK